MPQAFKLCPEFHDYVWGGGRLRPGHTTGEAWVVAEHDIIRGGAWDGLSLAEAAARHPGELLGAVPLARTGARFPLLIKLLDCAGWLSLQVHPDDAQAARLEGPEKFGKTEAWHFIETEPGAEIFAGLKPGVSPAALEAAVRGGGLVELAQRLSVRAGDSILIPAGMLHALGPGMLLCEVQQTSDITYRVYDWDRPASAGRPLHIPQSLAVLNLALTGQIISPPALRSGGRAVLTRCPYFTLELLAGSQKLDTGGQSFHALTVVRGAAQIAGAGWSVALNALESAVVPAAAGEYRVEADDAARMLLARVA
jgi:mannose-6-phosphate isomerase